MNILLLIILLIIIIIIFIVDNNTKIQRLPSSKKIKNYYPLKENDIESLDLTYSKKIECCKPIQSIQDFNKDFFDFRDYTYNNSSMKLDSVDKITDLYLDSGLNYSKKYPNEKIKDVFDDLTNNGVNLYQQKCVRLPYYDNTIQDGYNTSFIDGTHLTRDNWIYKNENQLNGGLIDKNLNSYDPDYKNYFPLNKIK